MTDQSAQDPIRAQRGVRVEATDADRFRAALAAAVDYRGDVTVERRDGADPVTGYLFDAERADDPSRARLRVLPADGGAACTIDVTDVAALAFTGRDTAEGKSFETWIRKYAEKKLKGEEASLFAEE